MEFRPGLCSACKASFRIPATFTASKAKCSKCGGTVEIGAVVTESAAAGQPAASAPPVPAKAISAPVADAAARLAAKPKPETAGPVSAKPAAVRPSSAQPLAKPTAAPVAKAAPVAAAKPTVAAKPAGAPAAAKPAAPNAKPAAKSATAPVGKTKPVAVHAAHTDVGEEDEEDRAERRKRLEKKKGLSPMLLGVSAVLFIAVVGGVLMQYSKISKQNAEKAAIAEAAKAAKNEELRKLEAERARLALEADAAATPEKPAAAKGEVLAAESQPKADETAKTEPAKPADKPAAKGPVEGFDVSTIADFGPTEGTSPEHWKELQELAALFVDPSAGARASRAGAKLMETPKESFPAILNQLKKLDLQDENGYRMADATQKLLERICKGHNVGWKYEQQENWLQYNQKAIKKWCDLWTKASTDEVFWNNLIKNDGAKAPEDGAAADGAPAAPKKIDDF